MQKPPVGCAEDSPGFDVDDGALDDLADLVDALCFPPWPPRSVRRWGFLVRGDHSPTDVSLVGDPRASSSNFKRLDD